MKRLTRNLIDNSIEAFVLALETINRPSVKYRMEAFCFLYCNSWELLMKAKLLHAGKRIFYKKKRKQPRRSLSLEDCLNRIFMSGSDPIKLNIKKIYDFRNDATHLVIPFVPIDIMGLFQAGVLNYPKALRDWFSVNLSNRIPLGMMVLVYDFDPAQHSLEHAKMTRKLSAETVRWLTEFQRTIREQATSLGEGARQFYIPIDLQLAIVKKPDKADIILSSGIGGQEALIFEVPKEIDRLYPYRQTELIEEVNQRLGDRQRINFYDLQCVRKVYNIADKAEFYYKPKYSSPQYSNKYVEWIIKQVTKNPGFFVRTRRKAKRK